LGKRQEKCLELIPDSAISILDLGCYTGLFANALKKKFWNKNILAGDYDTNNLAIARFIYPDISDIFEEINVYDMQYDNEYFDCIVFQDVIEHLEGAAHAVKEINRVLKTESVLIITTPSPYYYNEIIYFLKYEILRKFKKKLLMKPVIFFEDVEWNRHIYCWTPSTLLKVNGFEYISHNYCQEGSNIFSRLMLKLFPFFSPTMILKVKKVKYAPNKIV
jgi:2-polyprenyl-3-methyl-5-hydroxy-6-metoxy-1,4-benzoquinol methylase